MAKEEPLIIPPPTTAIGSLVHYITAPEVKHFPAHECQLWSLSPLGGTTPGRDKKKAMGERALKDLEILAGA